MSLFCAGYDIFRVQTRPTPFKDEDSYRRLTAQELVLSGRNDSAEFQTQQEKRTNADVCDRFVHFQDLKVDRKYFYNGLLRTVASIHVNTSGGSYSVRWEMSTGTHDLPL